VQVRFKKLEGLVITLLVVWDTFLQVSAATANFTDSELSMRDVAYVTRYQPPRHWLTVKPWPFRTRLNLSPLRADCAMAKCPSLCPSLCLSVTRRYYVEIAKHLITFFQHYRYSNILTGTLQM